MNIVLAGYRATGKTTVAEILAEKLSWPLVDTDTLIQERAGMSIQEIVKAEGWPGFRKREREVIADVAAGSEQVISAGGGAVIDSENVRLLKKSGKVFLLTALPETVHKRMTADDKTAAERPNLTDSDGIEEIRRVLDERREAYLAAADFEIDTDEYPPEEIAGRILTHLKIRRLI